jgi:hypothetical protein
MRPWNQEPWDKPRDMNRKNFFITSRQALGNETLNEG